MFMRSARLLILMLAPSVLAACASPPPAVSLPAIAAPAPDAVFAPGAAILSGFEIATSPEEWRIGDQILLGIRVVKPGTETIRFLHVELLKQRNPKLVIEMEATSEGRPTYIFRSSACHTRLSLYDEKGAMLAEMTGRYPEKLLGRGLYDAAAPAAVRARATVSPAAAVSDEEAERELLGWLSLFSFSMSMNKKGMFNDMMKDVIARPSLVAMLFNPNITLAMGDEAELQLREWAPTPGVRIDGVTVPLSCTIANKLGAVARVHAAKPVAPLGLSGGVVSIEGNNADKPDIRFEVRLLAARRGRAGEIFDETTEAPPP